MVGSIKWNLGFGLFGFILTFILSNSNNIFFTAFKHGLFSGFILFLIAFIFRWFIGTLFVPIPAESHVGNNFDLTIPDESDEIHQLMRAEDQKDNEDSDFKPLTLPKLVSKRGVSDPAELVKAIRHMSED
jgi:predicted membrane protein